MTKIFVILSLFIFSLLGNTQRDSVLIASSDNLQAVDKKFFLNEKDNLLNTVEISLDKVNNRINFSTPHRIEGVNISVKKGGDQVVIQQNNMTIDKKYSITFPEQAGISRYTIILQKDNNLVVKRLEKDWL